jgi:hypothetical protein
LESDEDEDALDDDEDDTDEDDIWSDYEFEPLASDDEDEPTPPPDQTIATSVTAAPSIVDDNGFTRVGPQPRRDGQFVKTAPMKIAESKVLRRVSTNLDLTDSALSQQTSS